MRTEFPRLLEVLVDHVEDVLVERQSVARVERLVEPDHAELDVRIGEVRIRAGAIPVQVLAHLDAVGGVEQEDLRSNAQPMRLTRRRIPRLTVDEFLRSGARNLDEELALLA